MYNIRLSMMYVTAAVIIMGTQGIINAQEEQKEIASFANLNPKLWGTLLVDIQKRITYYCDDCDGILGTYLTTQAIPTKNQVARVRNGILEIATLEEDRINYRTVDTDIIKNGITPLMGNATAMINFKTEKNKNHIAVLLENGTIQKMRLEKEGLFSLSKIQKAAHKKKKALDMAVIDKKYLASIGADGFLRVFDDDLNEKKEKEFNFRKEIGALPLHINYLDKQKLVLIESDKQDYVYFNTDLELVQHIPAWLISKLSISRDSMLIEPLEQILKITEKQGISFGTYRILRGLELAQERKRRFFIHPKEKRFLAEIPLPRKRLKEHIRSESILSEIDDKAKQVGQAMIKWLKEIKSREKKYEFYE